MTLPTHSQLFGSLLNTLRKNNRVTLRDAAQKAGISPSQLSHLETGTIALPEDGVLNRILDAVGITNPTEEFNFLKEKAKESGPVDPEIAFRKQDCLPAFIPLTPAEAEEFYRAVITVPSW